MSTRCLIGIKTNKGIKAVECRNDGYISQVGVLLNYFYRDIDKVQRLLDKGHIKILGIRELRPELLYNNGTDMEVTYYTNLPYKTSFTNHLLEGPYFQTQMPYFFDNEEEMMSFWGSNYVYLYDTSVYNSGESRWWVVASNGKKGKEIEVCMRKLNAIMNYKKHLYLIFKLYGNSREDADEEFENIQKKIIYYKKIMKQREIDICNHWVEQVRRNNLLQWRDLNREVIQSSEKLAELMDVEFGYSRTKDEGRTYAIFKKLREGQSKRICLFRSKDLNIITAALCKAYGINRFARPIFEDSSILN